jgi:futalosine hydrolase
MELRACLALLPAGDAGDSARPRPDSDGFGPGTAPPALSLPGCELETLICGVGPVAAALALGRRLGKENAGPRRGSRDTARAGEGGFVSPSDAVAENASSLRGILHMGLAGTYDAGTAPVGSLVLATEEAYPEYGVWPRRGKGAALPFPQAVVDGREIRDRLELDPDKALGNMGLNWHSAAIRGAGVTVAGVSGSPRRAAFMAALGKGLMENMEGFPLALGAAVSRLPFAELRAISNSAGQRPPHGWDVPAALAALGWGAKDLLAPLLHACARNPACAP